MRKYNIEKDTKEKEAEKGSKPRGKVIKRAYISIAIFIVIIFVLSLVINNGIFEINWFGIHIESDIGKMHNMLISVWKKDVTWRYMFLIIAAIVVLVFVVESNKTKRKEIEEKQKTERDNFKEEEKTKRKRIQKEREDEKFRSYYEHGKDESNSKERDKIKE